jgi:hypothetical protein
MRFTDRIHVLLDPEEKELFRRVAARAGKSLSEWLRDLGRAEAERQAGTWDLDTSERLDAFFAECDARETGAEPDWQDHLEVIKTSRAKGNPAT